MAVKFAGAVEIGAEVVGVCAILCVVSCVIVTVVLWAEETHLARFLSHCRNSPLASTEQIAPGRRKLFLRLVTMAWGWGGMAFS